MSVPNDLNSDMTDGGLMHVVLSEALVGKRCSRGMHAISETQNSDRGSVAKPGSEAQAHRFIPRTRLRAPLNNDDLGNHAQVLGANTFCSPHGFLGTFEAGQSEAFAGRDLLNTSWYS